MDKEKILSTYTYTYENLAIRLIMDNNFNLFDVSNQNVDNKIFDLIMARNMVQVQYNCDDNDILTYYIQNDTCTSIVAMYFYKSLIDITSDNADIQKCLIPISKDELISRARIKANNEDIVFKNIASGFCRVM